LLVADGLGHGPDAAEASVEAVRLFRRFQGHQVATLIDYIHGGLVILCSDGLGTSWTLARYPNLSEVHPMLIAAVLYRDFGRRRDDTTVLVGKWPHST
jgi:hypothetical protein